MSGNDEPLGFLGPGVGPDGNGNGNGGPGLPPPVIESVNPSAGRPGTVVDISGSEFHGDGSVQFELFVTGSAAGAAVVSWSSTLVRVVVPSLEELGGAGRGAVMLTSSILGEEIGSGTAEFTVLDVIPPFITSLSRTIAIPGDELRIVGDRFGLTETASPAVTFLARGVETVMTVLSWSPTEVRVRVPDRTADTGALRVHTLWDDGTPATAAFTIAEPPTITVITPDVGPPDAAITIEGRAFGAFDQSSSRVELRLVGPNAGQILETTEMEIERDGWGPETIRAVIPGLSALKTTGVKQVVVHMPLGESAPKPLRVTDVGSITARTRLEAHVRPENLDVGLETGLRAEVADPLWLLGRQWVLGELRGEDAGSPVVARLNGEAAPLWRWRPGFEGPAGDIPASIQLETLVERERIFPPREANPADFDDRRLAVEAGLQFLRNLAARVEKRRQADAYRRAYIEEYALAMPTAADRMTLDSESVRFLDAMADRVPDGSRLYKDLQVALPPEKGGEGKLPRKPQIDRADREAVLAAIEDWFTWCETLFSEPTNGGTTWQREQLEYAFAASAQTADGEVVLEAPEYFDGRLDWYAFVHGSDSLPRPEDDREPPEPTPIVRTTIPTPVTFPGMPAPRWWEFEDARVDLGSVDAGPPDLVRLLFVEFATVFGNNWFSIPLDGVPVGSAVRLNSLVVTDTFGETTSITPFQETGEGGAWRMFQLGTSVPDELRDLLVLPPTLVGSIESAPLEDVAFLRDELANMGWAVERTVMSETGRPLNRHEAYAEARRRAEAADEAENGAVGDPNLPATAYRLMTEIEDAWIPLLPVKHEESRRLLRGAMRRARPDGSGFDEIPPLGRILEPETPVLRLFDAEVPRAGARVTRTWQLARDANGGTYLWLGRRKEAGTGEGSSGLRFDALEER
jgi:hypothetical protein